MRAIYHMRDMSITQTALAKIFEVNQTTIRNIWNNKTWTSVTNNLT